MGLKKYEISKKEWNKICKYDAIKGDTGCFDKLFLQPVKPLIYVLSRRKHGKTALMSRIAENYHHETKQPIYCMGFPNINDYPPYFIPIKNPWEISMPGLLLVDEAGLNKIKLDDILAISGHKDFGLLYAGQTLKQIKPATIEMLDGFIFKMPTTAQIKFKMYRKEFKEVMEYLSTELERLKDKSQFYYFSSEMSGWFTSSLSSFWKDGVTSKGYKNFQFGGKE